MKKIFTKILSLIIIMALAVSLFTFNVSAASVSISGTGEYEVGKSFSVTIRFNADATLYAVEADVSYNASVLRLNSVSGADYNVGNGSVKIVDDGFSATKPSTTSSYTLNFTAIAAGNSNISVSVLGGGEAESKASASAAVTVVTPKPSSNANLASIKLSAGALSPAFSANTTNYTATVKYSVDSITITGAVADGGATYTGGGTFGLDVGDNSRTLTVTAADGTKKSYTINIKRMTEQETADAEQAARDADPLLVSINNIDYIIVNNFEGLTIPTGYIQGTAVRKETEIAVLNDESGKYQLYWLTDTNGENGAFYTRDDNDNFTRINYINLSGKMYIIEDPDVDGYTPDGFIKSKRTIDGIDVEVYEYLESKMSDFYIVKCYINGTGGYYRFDTVEETMQRAVDFDLAVIDTNTAPVEPEPEGKFAWFTNMNKTGKAVFIIVVLVAIILVAVAVIIIIKIAASRDMDFEDEFVPMADDDFVLDDYAEDISIDIKPQLIDDTISASESEKDVLQDGNVDE